VEFSPRFLCQVTTDSILAKLRATTLGAAKQKSGSKSEGVTEGKNMCIYGGGGGGGSCNRSPVPSCLQQLEPLVSTPTSGIFSNFNILAAARVASASFCPYTAKNSEL